MNSSLMLRCRSFCFNVATTTSSLSPSSKKKSLVFLGSPQDGAKETGVSLAFIVHALDAGPVIACEGLEVDDQIKAPDLLSLLFSKGSKLLIRELPSIFDGSAKMKAQPQDDSKATLAPKISLV